MILKSEYVGDVLQGVPSLSSENDEFAQVVVSRRTTNGLTRLPTVGRTPVSPVKIKTGTQDIVLRLSSNIDSCTSPGISQ